MDTAQRRTVSGSARLMQFGRTVMALILREMTTTYGRSPGGYVWAIVEPIAGTALLTFAFSLAFRSPPLGANFALFYATGLLPFMMYTDLSLKISQSIQFSKPLLFYPRVTYIDAILARFILNAITQLMVVAIIFVGIVTVFDLQIIINLPAIVLSLTMAAALGLGIGTLNCYLVSAFPVWLRIWTILNRPLFIVSCIFFLPESLPEPYRSILAYNPLVHVVAEMRRGYYPSYEADLVSPTYVFGLSAVCCVFGLVFLYRYNRDILNR